MASNQVEEFAQRPWVPVVEECPDGTYVLTVKELPDLEVFGTLDEVWADYPDMLRALLESYLADGRTIPYPAGDVAPG